MEEPIPRRLLDVPVGAEVADLDLSGRSFKKRAQIRPATQMIKSGAADVIVVWRVSPRPARAADRRGDVARLSAGTRSAGAGGISR